MGRRSSCGGANLSQLIPGTSHRIRIESENSFFEQESENLLAIFLKLCFSFPDSGDHRPTTPEF